MNILILDIETAPTAAYVWRLFKENIGIDQIIDPSETISWAAKWYGTEEIYFASIHHNNRKEMLEGIWEMLDKCDVVVHFNGKKFDIPTLNKEFIKEGMLPPSSYRQVDLFQVAKRQFRFTSNKLDYISQFLGVGKKVQHEGFELWLKCMRGDVAAWEKMREYNMGDVDITEKVYDKMLPWIPSHPNHGVYDDGDLTLCPNCGKPSLKKKGYAYTSVSKFQRYVCKSCGANSRGRKNLANRDSLVTTVAG